MERENAWKKCDEARIKEVFDFCEGYRRYISECKTERECVARSIEMAKEKGYENLFDVISEGRSLKAELIMSFRTMDNEDRRILLEMAKSLSSKK